MMTQTLCRRLGQQGALGRRVVLKGSGHCALGSHAALLVSMDAVPSAGSLEGDRVLASSTFFRLRADEVDGIW